jgi:Ca2+-binding EF-hand superfamily protein
MNVHRAAFVIFLVAAQCATASRRGDAADRRERIVQVLKRLDQNGDGQLAPDEIPATAQSLVRQIAQRAKLDPAAPLSIEAVERFVLGQRGATADDKAVSTAKSASKQSSGKPEERPARVQGFGEPDELPKVPGFDAPLDKAPNTAAAAVNRLSFSSASRSSSSQSSTSSSKIRDYAKSLLKQYDKNKNGVIDRDEWGAMKGDPEKDDINRDGRLTVDELVARLENYGSGGAKTVSRPTGAKRSVSSGSYIGRAPSDKDQGHYRTIPPIERLPRGLPDWFARNDANGDGQIAMSEFAASWTNAKAEEFASYDLNRDGVITPTECLEADKQKADKEKAAKEKAAKAKAAKAKAAKK